MLNSSSLRSCSADGTSPGRTEGLKAGLRGKTDFLLPRKWSLQIRELLVGSHGDPSRLEQKKSGKLIKKISSESLHLLITHLTRSTNSTHLARLSGSAGKE